MLSRRSVYFVCAILTAGMKMANAIRKRLNRFIVIVLLVVYAYITNGEGKVKQKNATFFKIAYNISVFQLFRPLPHHPRLRPDAKNATSA